ncbi:MAG: hypothetical protein F6K17_33390, partial [Okeania sp. SIO3C4]|nr:hypothetical protein [Okeania sp. SIO3C4]
LDEGINFSLIVPSPTSETLYQELSNSDKHFGNYHLVISHTSETLDRDPKICDFSDFYSLDESDDFGNSYSLDEGDDFGNSYYLNEGGYSGSETSDQYQYPKIGDFIGNPYSLDEMDYLGSVPTKKELYNQLTYLNSLHQDSNFNSVYEEIIITNRNLNNDSDSLVTGIFLYTDEDSEIVDYVKNNYEAFDKLTGDWCCIYVLEKKGMKWESLTKYWQYLLLSELHDFFKPISLVYAKPFNRNEFYKIARDLGIPIEQLPCLVFLPPLTEIFGQEKLVIPVKEASTKYFRKVFSTLEGIVNQTKEQNKYEAIKVKFDHIIQYLENNSEKVVQQTTTEYQINGTNIFVNSEIRRLKMTNENNPNIKIDRIDHSNLGSVTGKGKATQNQYNYPPEQKQNLAEAAKEIQQLLQQLSKPDYSATPTENAIIVGEVMQEIEKNPSLKSRIIEGLKQGGKEAFKELIDHPAVNVLMASIDSWNNAE